MDQNTFNIDKYNHYSILLFILPIVRSYILNCQKFFIFNSIYLIIGFSYHYSLYKIDKFTNYVKYFRILDITYVHIFTPFLIFECFFDNINILITIISIFMMGLSYYVFPLLLKRELPHLLIHICGNTAFMSALNSCYINKDICRLC
jgi:hypothetical protein